jgi:N-acetylmuramoyl-L-alanine amidase
VGAAPRIVTCREWGARPPRRAAVLCGPPRRIIVHHTAGHATDAGSWYERAVAYARMLQAFHMDDHGWNDSGHNFLVCRGGQILEGRHGSLFAVKAGRMVVSAHCPGQNDQPGIEHEHLGDEALTAVQKAASMWLHSFICARTGIRPSELHPHSAFHPTDCPTAGVVAWLPELRRAVARELAKRFGPDC